MEAFFGSIPRSDEDWLVKEMEIRDLFNPTHPVREADLFIGRKPQLDSLIDVLFQAGQHAVVYGDRGVGKTSLINRVLPKILSTSGRRVVLSTQCFRGDDFVDIWERLFKDHRWANNDYALDDIDDTVGPSELLEVVAKFKTSTHPVFIFDEFDRVTDAPTKSKMAETIKLFSDRSDVVTIVLVGVGRTISELLSEHESIKRAIRQIEMPRMQSSEIEQIITSRLDRLGMSIDSDALDTIVWLTRGMPAFAHLLGMYAAIAAIEHRKLHIDATEFRASLDRSLLDVDESTRQNYALATQSPQPGSLFAQSLLACAMAHADQFGRFTAAGVREPLSRILGKERSIPDFSRHLTQFCREDRGAILEKIGRPKSYRYRFVDPIMQSYVITKGLKDGMWRLHDMNQTSSDDGR